MHAAAMSLKNLLGLVCDPVAGIRSKIPPDEVIDAMRDIGEAMPKSMRETGEGGLAVTPTGQEIAQRIME